jgi:hypothetical protein
MCMVSTMQISCLLDNCTSKVCHLLWIIHTPNHTPTRTRNYHVRLLDIGCGTPYELCGCQCCDMFDVLRVCYKGLIDVDAKPS